MALDLGFKFVFLTDIHVASDISSIRIIITDKHTQLSEVTKNNYNSGWTRVGSATMPLSLVVPRSGPGYMLSSFELKSHFLVLGIVDHKQLLSSPLRLQPLTNL